MWPIVRRFGLLAVGVVALWLGSVLVLNLTVYSATGFVSSYLSALESRDYGVAAAKAGIARAPQIVPSASHTLENPRIVGTASLPTGELVIRADYELGGATESTVFVVAPGDPVLWFFDTWRFQTQPLATLQFVVIGDQRVTVNGTELSVDSLGVPPRTSVFVPGLYTSSLETEWVSAEPATTALTEVGSTGRARLTVTPTSQLLETTTGALEAYLDGCVAQGVLQPAECPFGVSISDRVLGEPQWSILDYPAVELRLSADRASWTMVASEGVAEVSVQVQSLFDGSITEFRSTEEFDVVGIVRGTTTDQPVLNLY
ncbi:hypothetical protein N9C74_00085 [Pontimonas sp.]|nr:hypothetical protein [Pontimonas sp.]